uniref:Uncharacterized protein n=1 Tax=Kalanchoe fedtschenkoi TaxID=63787 RepID=A0A7N0UP22_KALFE
MASACVNNVGVTPGKFSSYGGWLSSRVSFARDHDSKAAAAEKEREKVSDKSDLEKDAPDFEFRLDDPVAMLPADELICDGKLMPMIKQPVVARSPGTVKIIEAPGDGGGGDPYLFSPKAPRCTSRWKDILGLKKNSVTKDNELKSSSSRGSAANKSLKTFLHRSSKSSEVPLLGDSDCESLSMLSRLSLSSSSSSHELEDFPRRSLDAETINPISLPKPNPNPNPPPRVRLVKPRPPERSRAVGRSPIRTESLGVSMDSPRMNPSGKVVFQSLERSSSSPGSFSGGPRLKHGGMERSYSANVRVAPVLNVVPSGSSVFGLGLLFTSQQKKERERERDGTGGSSSSRKLPNH